MANPELGAKRRKFNCDPIVETRVFSTCDVVGTCRGGGICRGGGRVVDSTLAAAPELGARRRKFNSDPKRLVARPSTAAPGSAPASVTLSAVADRSGESGVMSGCGSGAVGSLPTLVLAGGVAAWRAGADGGDTSAAGAGASSATGVALLAVAGRSAGSGAVVGCDCAEVAASVRSIVAKGVTTLGVETEGGGKSAAALRGAKASLLSLSNKGKLLIILSLLMQSSRPPTMSSMRSTSYSSLESSESASSSSTSKLPLLSVSSPALVTAMRVCVCKAYTRRDVCEHRSKAS